MANIYNNQTVVGLNTTTFQVPVAGIYVVSGSLTLPTVVAGSSANSSVVVTINQNGTPVYTGAAGSRGFSTNISCALNDVLTVVLSSAASVDQGRNAVKMTLSIYEET